MKGSLFIMECLTNLHVGSGSFNYEIVDNQVERDMITKYPTIYSSSLKGAMREHFTRENNNNNNNDKVNVEQIFGESYKSAQENKNQPESGKVKFFDCKLLALPARSSKGKHPYYMVTTKAMLEEFCLWTAITGGKTININLEDEVYFIGDETENVELEYLEDMTVDIREEISTEKPTEKPTENPGEASASGSGVKSIFSNELLKNGLFILPEKEFNELSLPIRARNCLDNSKSVNLWYEEHVPYKSLFYTSFMPNGEKDSDTAYNSLIDELAGNKHNIIQVGGNASIGFGLLKFSKWGESNG